MRKLTQKEIEYVLSGLSCNRMIPIPIADSILQKNKSSIRTQLERVVLYPEMIDELKSEIQTEYDKTIVEPGESIGIITAQSIGEKQTQSTLNTFHVTGTSVKTVIAGVPRFSELLNATKDPKAQSCNIYFTKKFTGISDIRASVSNLLVEITIKMLVKNYEIITGPPTDEWYKMYEVVYGEDHRQYNERIRFYLDNKQLYSYYITLKDVAVNLEEKYSDLKCAFSPDEEGVLDVWISTTEIGRDIDYLTLEECKEVYIEDTVIPLVQNQNLMGIPGISAIFPVEKDGEWYVETEGSNLKKVLGCDFVDSVRTFSNNMWEIYTTLGIEAARNFLIDEFTRVVSSDGTFINDSHVILLVDIMTYSGTISSISRYGLKKEKCGPLAKASFEESLDNFIKAGVNGEIENIRGVSASVMLGKIPKIGSGLCDILVDIQKLDSSPSLFNNGGKVVEKPLNFI
jgi:DNA-directed RNA polymerase beta' subunit